jgi:hypothetical protein
VVLSRLQLLNALAAIGDVDGPLPGTVPGTIQALELQEKAVFYKLAVAATVSGTVVAGVEASGGQAGTEGAEPGADTDRDARCRGACLLLSISLPLWRLAFRDCRYFAGMLHAIIASRTYNTTPVQVDIGNVVIQMLGRFVHPPSLDLESGVGADLRGMMLIFARPGSLQATWRYTMLANILVLLLMPACSSKVSCLRGMEQHSSGAYSVTMSDLKPTPDPHLLPLLIFQSP